MIRNSPIKTPMQKLSTATAKLATRGSYLVDSASAAVAQGTQLSNIVASRAGARAEDVVAHVRSPDKMRRTSKGQNGSGPRGRGAGKGIRDRINKFDSASKSNMEYHSTTTFRNRNGKSREGNQTGHGCGTMLPVPPPYNPSFCGKENEPYREPSDPSLSSKDGGTRWTPTFRRKKNTKSREEAESHPVIPLYRENEAESATRDEWEKTESERERNESSESMNGYDRRQQDDRCANNEGADLAGLNHAADVGRSWTGCSNMNAKLNNDANFYGVQRSKKRDKSDHPLIASPLRKHIRGVHDSACANATCTVLKDPFPLLPPECANPLAAVANWEEGKVCGESGPRGRSNGGMGHLDTLGSVTGTWKGDGVGLKRGGGVGGSRGNSSDGGGKKVGEEVALDLLTSAAFMFKHSRRNLGRGR